MLLPIFPVSAQNVCFMTTSRGETVDLERICGATAQNKQVLSLDQQYIAEYKKTAALTNSGSVLSRMADARPDTIATLGKRVCQVLRAGGTRSDIADIWAELMVKVPSQEMRSVLADDGAVAMNVAPRIYCPEYVGKF